MKTQMQIIVLISVAINVACGFTSNQQNQISEPHVEIPKGTTYANEFGEIELIPHNDTLMQAIFRDNEKIVFDTLMKINHDFKLLPNDGFPFLSLQTGGIKIHNNCIKVWDFAGPAYMQMYASIENIYDRPFYKINESITIKDEIKHPKGGPRIGGIYLLDKEKNVDQYQNEFVHLKGIVTKEKYPRDYYSTPDGPQGMFGDTTEIHYRLVVKDYTIEVIKKETMTGRTMNINGQAAFIWDYADSEAYYLDGHAAWTEKELDKKITIEGVLVQFIDGKSVIKAWRIIE